MKSSSLIKKVFLIITMVLTICVYGSVVYADDSQSLSVTLQGNNDTSDVTLYSQDIDGVRYFLLPSGVTNKNIQSNFDEKATYETSQSANIASIFFVSSDPEKKGMDYVNGSPDHSAKAKGMIYMYDKDFNLIYSGEVSALKGRGNTTWGWTDKKPYQVKLEKKADLLDPINGDQKNKTWIFLSNPFDPTLIKNTMVYNFAKEIGLGSTPEGRPVDMYYDGLYRGSYYLCEKVEIDDGRVEIDDLEGAIEDANTDVDMDELETSTSINSYGNEFSYVKGLNDPEDITGGYLLEIDSVYYSGEKSWFNLSKGFYWVSKSPEYLSENMSKYISEHSQAIYNYIATEKRQGGEGTDLFKYIDKETFVKYLLTMEWFDNNDIWTSSTYLYKPKGDDKLYAGPVWDCDSIMGIRHAEKEPTGWKTPGLGRSLLSLPKFRKALKEIYISDIRPVVFETLIGNTDGKYLKTYNHMKQEVSSSLAMNDMIWEYNDVNGTYFPEETTAANYDSLFSLMQTRAIWLDEAIMAKDFVENKITVNRTKVPTLKVNITKKTIKVTIPSTKYTISNIVNSIDTKASDYQIAYRVKGTDKWKTVKTGGKLEYTLKDLGRKTYQIKVRAIAKTDSGIKYGKYSSIATTTTKKSLSKAFLSTATYTYNGKAKKPAITVKYRESTLLKKKTSGNSKVQVSYSSGRKNVGTYKVTVKGKGDYTGTIIKTFKIVPVKPNITKPASQKRGQITVKWKGGKKQASGYEVKYSLSKNFKKGNTTNTKVIRNYKTNSAKISKLKSNRTYYVKVRTYKNVNGKTYYSGWSATKKIKVK